MVWIGALSFSLGQIVRCLDRRVKLIGLVECDEQGVSTFVDATGDDVVSVMKT